jgi:hypothetical protein
MAKPAAQWAPPREQEPATAPADSSIFSRAPSLEYHRHPIVDRVDQRGFAGHVMIVNVRAPIRLRIPDIRGRRRTSGRRPTDESKRAAGAPSVKSTRKSHQPGLRRGAVRKPHESSELIEGFSLRVDRLCGTLCVACPAFDQAQRARCSSDGTPARKAWMMDPLEAHRYE